MPHTLISGYDLKKKNRRIEILCYRNDDDPNDFTFCINTKRLVDFKTRHIQRLNTIYGLESILAIKDVLNLTIEEPLFQKLANVAIHKACIEKYKGSKYVNHDMLNSEQGDERSVANTLNSSNSDWNKKVQ